MSGDVFDGLFRPRDELDQWTHPDSLRGKALTLMDKTAGTVALIYAHVHRMPWYRRWPARLLMALAWVRIRIRAAMEHPE